MALGLVTWLLTGIRLDTADAIESALTLLGVGLLFGVVNAVVKPLVTTLGGCMIVLTLGLFTWLINAAMLLLTSWLAGQVGLGWHVDDWRAALIGALVLSIISVIAGSGSRRR